MNGFTRTIWMTILLLAVPSASHAGNSRSFLLGDEAAITGGAGIAVFRDSGSLWYNPAGLGGLTRGRMELTGTVYNAKLRKLEKILEARLPSGTHTATARADDFGSVPTSLVFVRQANDAISYGAAWYQTRDEWIDFRTDLDVPFDGSSLKWSEGIEYHQRAYVYHIGPSIGIQLLPRLRIGASLYFVYSSLSASFTGFAGVSDPAHNGTQNDTFLSVNHHLSTSNLGLMVAAGLQWQLEDNWHLGVMLRTPTFRVWESTDASDLASSAAVSGTDAFSYFSYTPDSGSKFTFKQTVPMEAQLGLVYKVGASWIGIEAATRPPLESRDQKQLWNASIGGRLALTDVFSWGAGVFTDNNSNESSTNLLNWRADRYGVTTGVEMRTPLLTKRLKKEKKKDDGAKPSTTPPGETYRELVWTTTLAVTYSFEFAEYNALVIDTARAEQIQEKAREGLFHQGMLYLGTALYF